MSDFCKMLVGSYSEVSSHLSVTNDPLVNPISGATIVTPDISTVESVVADTVVCQEGSKESAKDNGSKGSVERDSNRDKNKRKRNMDDDDDDEFCLPTKKSTQAIHRDNIKNQKRMAHARGYIGKG